MNLTELKTAWNEYDGKIKTVRNLNDKIVQSMIRERSGSRLSRIENLYRLSFVSNGIWILLIIAVLVGNPFDFTHPAQFIPVAMVGGCLIILTGMCLSSYLRLKKVDLYHQTVEESIRKIIPILENPWKYIRLNIAAMMLAALSFPLSFLPRAIQSVGIWQALVYELIPMIALAIVIYFIGFKGGLLSERYAGKFKADLSELEELKSISAELNS